MVPHAPIPRERPAAGQDQHGKPWVHPAARDDTPELAAAAGNGCHLSGAACILPVASLVPGARHGTCATVPASCPCKPLQPCGARGPRPGAGNKPVSQGYWANWEGGARSPPHPCHARTKQVGEDAAEPRDGDGDGGGPGGVGVTRLTPEDVTKGDGRWRTGTYREGGGGTEADLLHGVEEEAAGSHASLAPRLGEGRLGFQAVDPRPQLGPASLPGSGLGPAAVGARIRLPPSLRPSFFPSFPPSSASRAPGIPASLPRSRYQGPSQGSAPRLVPVKVGGVGEGGQLSHPTLKVRQQCTPKPRG